MLCSLTNPVVRSQNVEAVHRRRQRKRFPPFPGKIFVARHLALEITSELFAERFEQSLIVGLKFFLALDKQSSHRGTGMNERQSDPGETFGTLFLLDNNILGGKGLLAKFYAFLPGCVAQRARTFLNIARAADRREISLVIEMKDYYLREGRMHFKRLTQLSVRAISYLAS